MAGLKQIHGEAGEGPGIATKDRDGVLCLQPDVFPALEVALGVSPCAPHAPPAPLGAQSPLRHLGARWESLVWGHRWCRRR